MIEMDTKKEQEKNIFKEKKKFILIILIILFIVIVSALFIILKLNTNKIEVTIEDGDNITKLEVSEEGKVVLPVAKEKEGYKFTYYKADGEIFDDQKIITEKTVLEPVYIPIAEETVTISFNLDEDMCIKKYIEKAQKNTINEFLL